MGRSRARQTACVALACPAVAIVIVVVRLHPRHARSGFAPAEPSRAAAAGTTAVGQNSDNAAGLTIRAEFRSESGLIRRLDQDHCLVLRFCPA
jgi:hypothetical protein